MSIEKNGRVKASSSSFQSASAAMARRFSDSSTERDDDEKSHPPHKETFPPFIFIHSAEVEEENAVPRIYIQ